MAEREGGESQSWLASVVRDVVRCLQPQQPFTPETVVSLTEEPLQDSGYEKQQTAKEAAEEEEEAGAAEADDVLSPLVAAGAANWRSQGHESSPSPSPLPADNGPRKRSSVKSGGRPSTRRQVTFSPGLARVQTWEYESAQGDDLGSDADQGSVAFNAAKALVAGRKLHKSVTAELSNWSADPKYASMGSAGERGSSAGSELSSPSPMMVPLASTKSRRDFKAQQRQIFETAVGDATSLSIDRETFLQMYSSDADKKFGDLLFKSLDVPPTGRVNKVDFIEAMVQLHHGTEQERLDILFQVYDEDKSGGLNRAEIEKMMSMTLLMSNVKPPPEELQAMVDALMQDGEGGFVNELDFEHFQDCICGEAARKANRFSQKTNSFYDISTTMFEEESRAQHIIAELQSNFKVIFSGALVSGIAVVAFAISFHNNNSGAKRELMGITLPIAKGSAQVLRLTFTLLLLPVSKNLTSYLRETFISAFIPFDDRITFHRVLGKVALFFTALHVGAHCFNYANWSDSSRYALWALAFPDDAADGEEQPTLAELWSAGISLTGLLMCGCFVLAMPFALRWPRDLAWFNRWFPKTAAALNSFNSFYITHQLLLVMYAAFIMHPPVYKNPDSLCWVGVPVALHLLDRVNSLMKRAMRPKTHMEGINILAGGVVELRMSKPPKWRAKPGSYVYIKVPVISRWEWHPFSVSSAPDDDCVTLHIRKLGDWTGALYSIAEGHDSSKTLPSIFLDGPYGAPAVGTSSYEVLMLIGAGIGVTPFAAVVKDLVHKIKRANGEEDDETLGRTGTTRSTATDGGAVNIKKIYMFVIVATAEEGTWFKDAIEAALAYEDGQLFEYHLHITKKAAQKADAAHAGLFTSMRRIVHRTTGRDVITGMRVSPRSKAKMGRPNWDGYFSRISEVHEGSKVGVFFCGPLGLGLQLNRFCQRYSKPDGAQFRFFSESFRV
mmetsp:Transcript_43669/g.103058  ORF Transcript_43669/g.103058 Transcript_43669/m.103058 type:complete len:951 (+) Transcript_43669:101-2953(+)